MRGVCFRFRQTNRSIVTQHKVSHDDYWLILFIYVGQLWQVFDRCSRLILFFSMACIIMRGGSSVLFTVPLTNGTVHWALLLRSSDYERNLHLNWFLDSRALVKSSHDFRQFWQRNWQTAKHETEKNGQNLTILPNNILTIFLWQFTIFGDLFMIILNYWYINFHQR